MPDALRRGVEGVEDAPVLDGVADRLEGITGGVARRPGLEGRCADGGWGTRSTRC